MNKAEQENLLDKFQTFLEQEQSLENETKPLTESKEGSEARLSIDQIARDFWSNITDECKKREVNFEEEWVRIRKNLGSMYSRSVGYTRTRPLRTYDSEDKLNENQIEPDKQLNNKGKVNLTVQDFTAV